METKIEEIWKPIPGFSWYNASSLGRIKSLEKHELGERSYRIRKEKILRPSTTWKENLRFCSFRENTTFHHNKIRHKHTSKYIGVSWASRERKWKAQILINKKHLCLGVFKTEEEAHKAYQRKLMQVA